MSDSDPVRYNMIKQHVQKLSTARKRRVFHVLFGCLIPPGMGSKNIFTYPVIGVSDRYELILNKLYIVYGMISYPRDSSHPKSVTSPLAHASLQLS